ncbi:MAG: hypothetical protein R6U29_01355, partial [Desulfosudaceae bacterium]
PVVLDGTASFDIDDGIASYAWTQTSGPEVTMSGLDTSQATFTAPQMDTDQALYFRLTVKDAAGQSASDHCSVRVKWTSEPSPKVADTSATGGGGGGGGGGCFIESLR